MPLGIGHLAFDLCPVHPPPPQSQSMGARNRVGIGLSYQPARRNWFLGIDSWAPYKFKNFSSVQSFPLHRSNNSDNSVCKVPVYFVYARTTEYTDWQWPLSGVQSIMIEKSAHSGEGGDARPPPFTPYLLYHHEQSCGVRSSWEGRYTPLISHPPLYVICSWNPPPPLCPH